MPSTSVDFVGRCYYGAASYLLEECGAKIIVTGPLVHVDPACRAPETPAWTVSVKKFVTENCSHEQDRKSGHPLFKPGMTDLQLELLANILNAFSYDIIISMIKNNFCIQKRE